MRFIEMMNTDSKSRQTVKLILVVLILLLSGGSYAATKHVLQDFETGNRETEKNKCWQFSRASISSKNRIQDYYSMRTGKLSGGSHTLTSPFIKFTGDGLIKFYHKLSKEDKNDKSLQLILLDKSGNQVTVLFDHQYGAGQSQTRQEVIKMTYAGIYRLKWVFTGNGGSSRGILDDIDIFGEYYANPTGNDGNGYCPCLEDDPDSDGDGVPDDEDDYPDDPYRAFDNEYPGKEWGTLAFEDLWPSTGDFDLNDLVIDYYVKVVSNAQNEIVEIKASLETQAIGASFHNAFGINLMKIPSASVLSVTNSLNHATDNGYFQLWETGVEAGQTWATVIAFDDAFKVLPHPVDGNIGVNTTPGGQYVQPSRIDLLITLMEEGQTSNGSDPVSMDEWNMNNLNFFMVIKANEGRGREVHLPDFYPTDLADLSLFGTMNDRTNIGSHSTYRSDKNLVWAINIPIRFAYPVEKVPVNQAYLKFYEWAQSGGNFFQDWYENRSGYRNAGLIY